MPFAALLSAPAGKTEKPQFRGDYHLRERGGKPTIYSFPIKKCQLNRANARNGIAIATHENGNFLRNQTWQLLTEDIEKSKLNKISVPLQMSNSSRN